MAVSIPIFTSQLEKAREATDVANMRAAKAEAVADYLSADLDTNKWDITTSGSAVAYYDAGSGLMVKDKPSTGYGKGTTADGGTSYDGYTKTESYSGKVIKVTITTGTGAVALEWVAHA